MGRLLVILNLGMVATCALWAPYSGDWWLLAFGALSAFAAWTLLDGGAWND